MQLPGICNRNPETTVFCHLNGAYAGKGIGQKAHDIAGFFGCSDCHRHYDTGGGVSDSDLLRAVIRTWIVLAEDQVIIVPRDVEAPTLSKRIKPRKPKDERKSVQSSPFPKPKHKYSAARGRVVER